MFLFYVKLRLVKTENYRENNAAFVTAAWVTCIWRVRWCVHMYTFLCASMRVGFCACVSLCLCWITARAYFSGRGPDRDGNTRSCSIKALPDEQHFYKEPGLGAFRLVHVDSGPSCARASARPKARLSQSESAPAKVLLHPVRSTKPIPIRGKYKLFKSCL